MDTYYNFAAFSQNLRSALQKHLKSKLTLPAPRMFVFYAIPFAVAYCVILNQVFDLKMPNPNVEFIFFGIMGGLTQIIATGLLVYLFSFRNFAVGTAYSKTETAQTAIFGLVILGDTLTPGAILGIAISLIAVMAISTARQETGLKSIFSSLLQKTALIGIASGTMFGISEDFLSSSFSFTRWRRSRYSSSIYPRLCHSIANGSYVSIFDCKGTR